MMPKRHVNDITDLLWPNSMNYGSTCRQWSKPRDTLPWCYVGFDSTCADRKQREFFEHAEGSATLHQMPQQFWSVLPCLDANQQATAQAETQNRCRIFRFVFLFFAIVQGIARFLLGPPGL
jgi:hypothetical protein